ALQQSLTAPALKNRGQLPAEIEGVLNARVHPEPAVRWMRMCRVAGEEHATVHKPVGDRSFAYPEILVLDRVSDLATHETTHQGWDVSVLKAALVEIDQLQSPQILAVDDRQERPRTLRPDKHVAKCFSLIVLGMKVRNPEIDGH